MFDKWLQAKLMRRFEHVPGVVSKFMTQEVYSKARSYGLDNNKFGNIKDWFSTIITTVSTFKLFQTLLKKNHFFIYENFISVVNFSVNNRIFWVLPLLETK